MNKRVIVTGGAGFIGSHLVDFLLKKNFEVLVLDNLSTGKLENINKRALFKKIDICNKSKLSQIFSNFKPEYVFHLAGQSLVNCQKVNVLGTKNIINASISSRAKKLIFTSSVSIYGNTREKPVKENFKLNPINTYGKSKLNAEQLILNDYKSEKNLYFSILRLSNVYGPKQRFDKNGGAIPIFCSKIKNNKPLPIYGNGKQKRDFIYISDVVQAIYNSSILKHNNISNISNGVSINLLNLIKTIEKVTNKKAELKILPTRKGDIRISQINSKLSQKILDWKPKIDLNNGIKNTFQYVK